MIPSVFQKDIFDKIKNTNDSILIKASAGSGKTTTIVHGIKLLPKDQTSIFLAFNKSIADTLKNKLNSIPNTTVSTIHGYGLRNMMRHFGGKCVVDEYKIINLAKRRYFFWEKNSEVEENKYTYCDRIQKLVSLMRLTYSLEDDEIMKVADTYDIDVFGNEIEHAKEILELSCNNTSKIDYTDMIFMPVYYKIKMPRFDNVFIDEAQDLGKCQQKFIQKLIKQSGRLIAVGDPDQAIYGFAGADFNSFNNMKTLKSNMIEMPLSICYRCGKEIIKHIQEYNPGILPDKNQESGEVIIMDPEIKFSTDIFKNKDVILCRNNAPLVALYRKLISEHKKCYIKGKEIGKNLILLIKKTKRKTMDGVMTVLKKQREELIVKLKKRGVFPVEGHIKYQHFNEKIKIVDILSRDTNSVLDLISRIEKMFVDDTSEGILLSTIHKFKGLENDNIYFLYSNLIPNMYANTKEELMQENNLRYVAMTRAVKKLIYFSPKEEDLEC